MTAIPVKNVVLVHGGFVDGSGWQGVYDALTQDGYRVRIVQNPTVSLDGDVTATRQVLDTLDGPTVLVGHCYGGAAITQAGTHPNVVALVYIAAFTPDKGESVNTLIADPPPGAPVPPILPPADGLLLLDRDKFAASFAGDLPAQQAAFMADSQLPWGVNALAGAVSEPAWRIKPSWYLVATDDRMIPPPAQRAMSERAGSSVVEVAASHSVDVSQPAAVAAVRYRPRPGRQPARIPVQRRWPRCSAQSWPWSAGRSRRASRSAARELMPSFGNSWYR
jgi:Alpha/beta hydrolase family